MKSGLETYKIWAPDDAMWTAWAKPVLFATQLLKDHVNLKNPDIHWITSLNSNTMIVLDLPGIRGVEEAIVLAKMGYRPVPLYNGVGAPESDSAVVKVADISKALYSGAYELENIQINLDAPPAFMLDVNRMRNRVKQPGTFDNRWCVFPQDMPSSSLLVEKGIKKIIVRSDSIEDDLSHILYRYQEKDIEIYLCKEGAQPKNVKVSKPSQFRGVLYRFKVILGLTRNAAGGFGGYIPDPSENTRYYGMG